MKNILISSGGRRVSLVRAFKTELKKVYPESKVFVVDATPQLSAAAQIADGTFEICKIQDKNYTKRLLEICVENDVKLVIPTLDTELSVLSKEIKTFKEKGIALLVSDEAFIEISENKVKTQNFFEKIGINVAKLYSNSDYKLPLYIKPINGSSSIDNYIIKAESDFAKKHFLNKKYVFFEYLDHNLYDEYTCDLFYNKEGVLKSAIPRKRIEVRGGEVSKGLTVKNEVHQLIIDKLKFLEGVRGCITVQFFKHKTENDIRGIEVNPRFGGGFPLSYLAGGNFPKWIVKEYLVGEQVDEFNDWEEHLLMLRYDDEILVHGYKE